MTAYVTPLDLDEYLPTALQAGQQLEASWTTARYGWRYALAAGADGRLWVLTDVGVGWPLDAAMRFEVFCDPPDETSLVPQVGLEVTRDELLQHATGEPMPLQAWVREGGERASELGANVRRWVALLS